VFSGGVAPRGVTGCKVSRYESFAKECTVRKLLWILSTVMLLGTLVTPSYVKADGNPNPTCPMGSTACKGK